MSSHALLFLLILSLHNLEEALWLPAWRQRRMPQNPGPRREVFWFMTLCVTALGYLAAGLHLLFPDALLLEQIFLGYVGLMLVNALVSHLLPSILRRSYCPGALTATLLLLPFCWRILHVAVIDHLKLSEVLLPTVILAVLGFFAVRLLERVGEALLP